MRLSLGKITCIALLLTSSGMLGACSKHSPAPAPGPNVTKPTPHEQPQTNSGWVLTFKSICKGEDTSSENCLGAYGFSVQTNGKYTVGPSPTNEVRTGTLTEEEQNTIIPLVQSVLADLSRTPQGEASVLAETGSDDTVTLAQGSESAVTLVATTDQKVSFKTKSVKEAQDLLTAIRNLAVQYYTLPFPDACLDVVGSVETLFNSMKTCNTDSDCAYFDYSSNNLFEVIPSTSTGSLTTENCEIVQPVVVGNASAIAANKDKLSSTLFQIRDACGMAFRKENCSWASVELTGSAPVCKENVCQINTTSTNVPNSSHR